MNYVYLATPYSHPDSGVREFRFVESCATAAKLMNIGFPVVSPIAHSHPIAAYLDQQRLN